MNNYKIIKEHIDIDAVEGGTVKAQLELEKNAKYLIGIAITSDRDELAYHRGSQKILINDRELFPEGYETRLLMSGLNVSPDDRMASIGSIPTGNGKLDVWLTDSFHDYYPFAAYRIRVYAYSITEEPSAP